MLNIWVVRLGAICTENASIEALNRMFHQVYCTYRENKPQNSFGIGNASIQSVLAFIPKRLPMRGFKDSDSMWERVRETVRKTNGFPYPPAKALRHGAFKVQ